MMIDQIPNQSAETVRLDNYFAAVWRAKWLILLVALAAAAATYYLRNQPAIHPATAILEVGRVWKEPLDDTYIVEQTVNSPGFRHELAQKIGVRPRQLQNVKADTITAGPNRTRYPILLRITASTPDESESIRLAEAVATELIARHEKLFDEALATHRETQRRLEEHWKELKAQSGASRELLIKIEAELDQVKFNNTSPTVTKKTGLIEPVVADGVVSSTAWSSAASAGVLAAIAAVILVALLAYFKPLIQSAGRNRYD
jgi:hypothetical protein